MTIDQLFIKFIMDNNLKDRYMVDEIFRYDYEADEVDYSTLEVKKTYEKFYLHGGDLYKAFLAGAEARRELEQDYLNEMSESYLKALKKLGW